MAEGLAEIGCQNRAVERRRGGCQAAPRYAVKTERGIMSAKLMRHLRSSSAAAECQWGLTRKQSRGRLSNGVEAGCQAAQRRS